MNMLARALALFPLVSLTSLLGCGPGILTPDTAAPPLFHLEVEAQGSLTLAGDVRGALAWSVYSDELVECMDAVVVDGPIEFADDGFPEDDPAYALMAQMQRCLSFSERGHIETDSVAVSAQFPASFTIPVDQLPTAAVLTGNEGARLGIGDVLVYLDDDGDGAFSETPLSALAFTDRVVGTSLAFREDDADESFLVWREGEVSSVWKLYRGIYGCADPPEGFSTVTLRAIDEAPYVTCTIDASAVPVELDDSGVRSLACAADPDRHVPQRPIADQGLPAGAVGECVFDEGYDQVRYTVETDSVCPDLERYDLVGCSDLTTESACRQSSWDLRGNEPGWWPCKFSSGLFITLEDDAAPVTDGLDDLFVLTIGDGIAAYPLADVSVAIVIDEAGTEVVFDGASLTLTDLDNNGAFSTGDALAVRELVDTFSPASTPGVYQVTLRVAGAALEAVGLRYWQPLPIPELAPLELTGADATADLSFGVDDVALVTWSAVAHAPFAVADVTVRCSLGGELPVSFALGDDGFAQGTITLANDANDDGLFGLGDTLLLAERENVGFGLDPDGLASFGGALFCNVSLDVGFNAFVHAGGFTVGLDGTALP